jgi:hypothetical protein
LLSEDYLKGCRTEIYCIDLCIFVTVFKKKINVGPPLGLINVKKKEIPTHPKPITLRQGGELTTYVATRDKKQFLYLENLAQLLQLDCVALVLGEGIRELLDEGVLTGLPRRVPVREVEPSRE